MVARALHDEVCAGLARAADLGPDACEAGPIPLVCMYIICYGLLPLLAFASSTSVRLQ